MEILGQSTKAVTPQPYVHLGYVAASNRGNFMVPLVLGILLFIAGVAQLYIRKKRHCIGSIIAVFLGLLFIGLSVVSYFDRPRISLRVISGTNLKGLGTAIIVYAHENNGDLPDSENWCDLLIKEMDVSPLSFRMNDRGIKTGESIYALNENVVDMKLSEIPADVVLLFETNKGIKEERTTSVLSRGYAEFLGIEKDYKVFENRWNQVGGVEDITTEYQNGQGAYVLFGDGHPEFVKIEDIPNFKWHPEESEMPLEGFQ